MLLGKYSIVVVYAIYMCLRETFQAENVYGNHFTLEYYF